MTYEEILREADRMNLNVREKPLRDNDGLIWGNRVAIRKDLSTREKACVLAEEVSHALLSVGDITDYTDPNNRKQEQKARTCSYMLMVTPEDLINAFEHGCRNRHEIAEFLDVTEQFLTDAIERYHEIYGLYQRYGDYIIMYEPCLGIVKFQ